MIVACFSVPVFADVRPDSKSHAIPKEEQDKRAREIFSKILELTAAEDRRTVIPEMEKLYLELIDTYPQSGNAHESYYRLMLIYLNDVAPPAFEKAEKLLDRYYLQYPDMSRINPVSDTLADAYYQNGTWQKLLNLCRPVVKQFIDDGTLIRPLEMYYYSEAKYHLGDRVEAAKGYRIVIATFPRSRESQLAEKRLAETEEQKKEQ